MYSAVLTIDTPALLFPAISFILLAYTTRYLALAELIRKLLKEFEERPHLHLHQQIAVLKRRVNLIRQMQTVAIVAMLLCIVAMLLLYLNDDFPGKIAFGVALIAMVGSLILAMLEVQASTHALDIELDVANRGIADADADGDVL